MDCQPLLNYCLEVPSDENICCSLSVSIVLFVRVVNEDDLIVLVMLSQAVAADVLTFRLCLISTERKHLTEEQRSGLTAFVQVQVLNHQMDTILVAEVDDLRMDLVEVLL